MLEYANYAWICMWEYVGASAKVFDKACQELMKY